jgi:hypothetical protein
MPNEMVSEAIDLDAIFDLYINDLSGLLQAKA